jgi:rhodanese-related sulfurtransferase
VTSRIDLVLSAARSRLRRLTPQDALTAVGSGAVVVDIRPAAQRAEHGELPGALLVDRNVLEWRLDPTSDAALPIADDDLHVIVLCQQGYSSSLAAAALQDVGVRNATDVIGGHDAWVAAGVQPPAAARDQRRVTRSRTG